MVEVTIIDNWRAHHYQIDESGNVIELYLANANLNFAFKIICKLKYLEYLSLENCNIKQIPNIDHPEKADLIRETKIRKPW